MKEPGLDNRHAIGTRQRRARFSKRALLHQQLNATVPSCYLCSIGIGLTSRSCLPAWGQLR